MSIIEKALAKQKGGQKTNVDDLPASEEVKTEATPSPKKTSAPVQKSVAPSGKEPIELNEEMLLNKGFIVQGHEESHRLKEEFRQIKRKLLNNAFGLASGTLKNGNLVMVSSSMPNEGKTYISLNLAFSIALEQDKTVLLIDADVLKPSINKTLEIPEKAGLVDYLLSEVTEVGDIIYNTNIPNLKIVPAGKKHYLTNELLASDRMAQLASELAERYPDRIVVFDSPPILGVTETPILAGLMGQALLVVEESKTRLENVKLAASYLHEDMAVGLVMNKALKTKRDGYGYYSYGYGYGKED